MNIKLIIPLIFGVFHFSDSRCNYQLEAYMKQKYYRNYHGNDPPGIRCHKEGGHCLRHGEKCKMRSEYWQTSCDSQCDCCFKSSKQDGLIKKRTSKWVLMKRRMTWSKAEEYCERKNGALLVPNNVWDIIQYIREAKLGTADIWVGINDENMGIFQGIYRNHIDSNAWQRGHPRTIASSGKNCVVAEDREHDEGLKVEPCRAKNIFICDFNNDRDKMYNVELIKISNNKGLSAVYGEGIILNKEKKSWKEARKDCQEKGGDLLIPAHIADLVTYMKEIDMGNGEVLIGYSDHYHDEEYVGIHGNEIDGGWMKDQPKSIRPGDNCLAVEDNATEGHGMKVEDCEEEKSYACDISEDFRSRHSTEP